MTPAAPSPWWKTGVLYQIYPRSFADSNADGVGDIPGIIEHLDHLEWLGVDGIWLSPVTVSPNADWGYDVSDFCAIAPEFGTLDDFDRLVAEAGARGIRVLMDIVPNHTSDQHPWFVDVPLVAHVGPPGLVRLGRRQGRRGAAEQLGQQLRRPGLDARRGDRPVLLPQPPAGAARPQLVERGRARRLRRHLPLLVRPGRGRVPHRRVQRHHQGRRAPRQPAGDRGRRLRDADVRAAQRVQRQPARGARGHPALAAAGRRLRGAPAPDRGDAGPRGQAGGVLRRRRRTSCGLAFNFAFISAPFRAPEHAGHRRGDRGGTPAGRLAGVDGLQPRHVPLPHPLGRGRSRQGPPGAPHAAVPARHPGPLPGRRDRHGERRRGPRGPARPARRALLPVLRGARRRPHADAVERSARAAASPTPSRPWLPLGDVAAANVAAQRDDPGSVLTLCRDIIAFRRRPSRVQRRGHRVAARRPRRRGRGRGATATWSPSTCPRRRWSCDGAVRHDSDLHRPSPRPRGGSRRPRRWRHSRA